MRRSGGTLRLLAGLPATCAASSSPTSCTTTACRWWSTMASIFGAQVLGMRPEELILFFLLIQGTAFAGRTDPRPPGGPVRRTAPVLLLCVGAWTHRDPLGGRRGHLRRRAAGVLDPRRRERPLPRRDPVLLALDARRTGSRPGGSRSSSASSRSCRASPRSSGRSSMGPQAPDREPARGDPLGHVFFVAGGLLLLRVRPEEIAPAERERLAAGAPPAGR